MSCELDEFYKRQLKRTKKNYLAYYNYSPRLFSWKVDKCKLYYSRTISDSQGFMACFYCKVLTTWSLQFTKELRLLLLNNSRKDLFIPATPGYRYVCSMKCIEQFKLELIHAHLVKKEK